MNGGGNPLRAVAIDDWSQRNGFNYGTIVVDLERRTGVDALGTRSAERTTEWLEQRPEIEIVSRNRCGLYEQGRRQGAPQARQVADYAAHIGGPAKAITHIWLLAITPFQRRRGACRYSDIRVETADGATHKL
ncbi:transposase [Methylocapsa aurea]|uniref:transposase n=1 Tax=Methylocapsa aurea TaxID=663610 RepID=UPI000A9F0D0F|nr:transposase [Methylocapsa aurea]